MPETPQDQTPSVIPAQTIERRILMLRGQKVLLDMDLADLYGVATKRLNEQVKRNQERFPADFMFRLNRAEVEAPNRSQFATGGLKLHALTNVYTLPFLSHADAYRRV